MNINWLCDGVPLPELDYPRIEQWLKDVAMAHDRTIRELTYIFCDDNKILDVNRQFLNHDYFTDIITFDYSKRKFVSGDMFISVDTVGSNAQGLGVDYDTELKRVVVHGLLHLCGIDDKGPGEREIMEQHENTALAML